MIRVDRICDKLIWLLTLFYVVAFYVFYAMSWGRYLYFGIAGMIFLLTAIKTNGVVHFPIGRYHWYVTAFAVYCLASSLWAWDAAAAVSKFSTLLLILLTYSLMYPYYSSRDSVKDLIDVLMWAGYIVSIYSILYYGFDELYAATAAANLRLENTYNNVNSISMLCAFSLVIQFYKLLYEKVTLSAVFAVPALLVVAAMQSRKAIMIVVVGAFLALVLRNVRDGRSLRALVRIVMTAAVFVAAIVVLSRFDLFKGVNERLTKMIMSFTGEGAADHSSLLRASMRRIGLEQFWKTPVFGIGIGSSGALLMQKTGLNTYLHNNYIELLACGGLVGALLYYLPLLSIGRTFVQKRRFAQGDTAICLIILLLLLMLDYGAVSYSSKEHYLYLMIFCIQADKLRAAQQEEPAATDKKVRARWMAREF